MYLHVDCSGDFMDSCHSRPDTYFIQRAVEMGLRAIEARLDLEKGYRPWFLLQLSPVPELQHSIWDLGDLSLIHI